MAIKDEIREQQIAAYDTIVSLFPTATDMARELGIDNRARVSQWKKRGVPLEYIMILDILGLVSKDMLIPAIKNWDMWLNKYETQIENKLQKVVIGDSLKKTAKTFLQAALREAVRLEVYSILTAEGVITAPTESPEEEEQEDIDSVL